MSMDNMYKMRAAHQEADKKEAIRNPVSGEEMELGEHDRTLAEIFQDKKEQEQFLSRYLYERDPEMAKDIAETLANQTPLTSKQETFLEMSRVGYNVRRAEMEKVRETITREEITHIAQVDPRIQEIVGKVGPEKAAELLGKEFVERGMSDTKGFGEVVKHMRAVRERRTSESAAELDRKVRDTLQKYGIGEEQYWDATRSGATWETRDKLAALAAESYGIFGKTIDFLTMGGLSDRAGRNMTTNLKEQMSFLATCDNHLRAIGKVLQGTLTPEVRLALQKYMLEGGSLKEKKVENNITTVQDYRKMKDEVNPGPDAIKDRWDKYKAAEFRRLNIRDVNQQPAVLERMKDSFSDKELRDRKEYRASGALAALIALLFATGPQQKDEIKSLLT